jgi:hypothetical protein
MLTSIFDYFKEVFDSIKERIQNPFTERNRTPFAGAYLITLVLYNWRLVFSLLSFDRYETRLTKLEIISNYLASEPWYSRVGWPILIAFLSIVLFYIFNNLSLGLTSIFNRWFKGLILYYTDRAKIVARDEYDRLSTVSKQSNYKLKKALLDTEVERAELDKQLTELTSKYEQVISENDNLKQQKSTERIDGNREAFRIVFAKYGAEETYSEVTATVQSLLSTGSRFPVDNKTLEVDPIQYSIKNLQIIYEHNGTHSITANEAEIVELKNGRLSTIETALSRKKLNHLRNQEKLGKVFKGQWFLTFTTKDGVANSEPVIVDNLGRYFAHSQHSYYLKTVNIDEANKRITFNKIDLQRKLHSKETLTIVNDGLITGTDSKGYRLEYRRQE